MAVTGTEPRISVVIPTLARGTSLIRVLEGLGRQTIPPGSLEVLVAIDSAAAPYDASAVAAVVAGLPYDARIVRGERPGSSSNRNAGARAARAPIVLFCDDDTIPAPGTLAEHLAWHDNHPEPEVSVLGLVRWSPEIRVNAFMKWLDRGVQFDYPFINGIEAGWGRYFTANVSSKRDFVVETVGGFDEVRFPYGYEDLDFGLRADRHGMRLLYNRAAVSDHLREMQPEFWLKRIRRIAVAERRFTEVHPEIEPWFKRIFEHVSGLPPARGWGRHLATWISPDVPLIGPRVWTSTDLYFKQLLAPAFLDAWEQAGDGDAGEDGPDLRERAT